MRMLRKTQLQPKMKLQPNLLLNLKLKLNQAELTLNKPLTKKSGLLSKLD